MSSEKLKTLTKHLEKYNNRLSSGLVPERRKETPEPYWTYVKREISRTTKKIETLQLLGPKK